MNGLLIIITDKSESKEAWITAWIMDLNLHFGAENLTEKQLEYLVKRAVDYALLHGFFLQSKKTLGKPEPAPMMLFPSPFPKKLFEEAMSVQQDFNLLVHMASQDHELLKESLKSTIVADQFIGRVYKIYEQTRSEGIAQPIALGIVRADYMLESDRQIVTNINECNEKVRIKQVEINTMAAGSLTKGGQMTKLHDYVLGIHDGHRTVKVQHLPINTVRDGLAEGLLQAWELYGSKSAIMLMTASDTDVAKYDHLAIEQSLHERTPRVTMIKRSFQEVHETAKLVDQKLFVEGYEIAVVYHRYGLDPREYPSEDAWSVRLLIERSLAIKCPTLAGQLVGTKKIQQVLAKPGVVERYIADEAAVRRIRRTFTGLYSLDKGLEGDQAVNMALNDPEKFLLKPQREGGGHNIFGKDIKTTLDKEDRSQYILMDMIRSPSVKNYIVRPELNKPIFTDVVGELGVHGVYISDGDKLIVNRKIGHVMRSKSTKYQDGSISSGIANYDSPFLF